MPTEAEREELIRQLLKLLDEIADEVYANPSFVYAKIAIAKQLVRKLSPGKSDGDGK